MLGKIGKLLIMFIFLIALSYAITVLLHEKSIKASGEIVDNDVRLKEYCIHCLAKEVSSEYHEEMLKTQAILVRTTVYKQIQKEGKSLFEHETKYEELDSFWKQKLEKVWDETEGQVVMYQDQLALVPFHQVSNGKTRSGEEVLGTTEYPYLQIVECPEDVAAPNQIANQFIPTTDIMIETWDEAGYVMSVSVGDEEISGEAFRDTYHLASSCFEVQAFDEQTRVLTKGVGHGLGVSQYTANELAKKGKTSAEILQFFFPGTEIKEVTEILWNIE